MRLGLVIALALVGCNPYDKDLGPAPFLCGPTEPRCPKNYTCMHDPNTSTDVCYANGTGPSFTCADDSAHEPNDTPQTATATGADAMKMVHLGGLAICPAGDVDTYTITIATASENLQVDVAYDADGAMLAATVSSTTATIATATPVTGMTDTIRATAPALSPGTYFVRVSGPMDAENNYSLTVTASGP